MENTSMPMNMESKFSISKRFWLALVLCLPILTINLSTDFNLESIFFASKSTVYIEMILSTAVVWVCGSIFFTKAWHALKKHSLNMFSLIVIAVFTAWFYSLFALFAPQEFPPEFHLKNGLVPVYFDAAAYVTLLVLWGHYMEMRARMHVSIDIMKHLPQERLNPDDMKNLMQQEPNTEMPMQKTIDKISEIFVLTVIFVAISTFILWRIYGPAPSGVFAIVMAVSVLLAACPCALSLASPISVMIAINKAAAQNILIKNTQIIEQIKTSADTVQLEKENKIVSLENANPELLMQAEMILVTPQNDPQKLSEFSRKVMLNIKENLLLGIVYNATMIPLASGMFYPLWGIMIGPVTASAAMSISSIIVIANALRLKKQL